MLAGIVGHVLARLDDFRQLLCDHLCKRWQEARALAARRHPCVTLPGYSSTLQPPLPLACDQRCMAMEQPCQVLNQAALLIQPNSTSKHRLGFEPPPDCRELWWMQGKGNRGVVRAS